MTTMHFQKCQADSQPPIRGPSIVHDSSKCTIHDWYYCHFRVSMDSFHFER